MRISKADLGLRVNAPLALQFRTRGLTSFAGLELVRRYFLQLRLAERLRQHLTGAGLETDFGPVRMVLLLLGLLIAGGRRLRHLMFLKADPLVLRFCGLQRVPTPRTVGRWLRRFTHVQLDRLLRVNDELVAEAIHRSRVRRLTIDVDGSVVSTGLRVEWAFRGYNPHHRKVPSYYPITAYEAQTGQILRVKNRPGNIQDGKASLGFLHDLFTQIRATLGKEYPLEFRMDGAFFRQDVLELLQARGATYAIKVPFYTWVGLKALVQKRRRWRRLDGTISYFGQTLFLDPWSRTPRVVIYRKRVHHWARKNFQLDLWDGAYGDEFRRVVRAVGIREILSAPQSPWQNPYAERVIGSIRRECLDHLIVLNEGHLLRILREYVRYYDESRPHGLEGNSPEPRRVESPGRGAVIAVPVLGGLHHCYRRAA